MLQQLLIWGTIYNCHNILPYNGVELKFFSFIKIIPETVTSWLLNIKCTVEELFVINVKIVFVLVFLQVLPREFSYSR